MASAGASAQPLPSPVRLLDVPYIQQSESLCGGAAAAMVMRYWGATGITAESFAPLLDGSGRGIPADALLRDLRGRGWDARSFRGDRSLVAARLADRQPVVALIEDRPGSFHFVVIVAWSGGSVIYHDPARTPFRVVREESFDAAWTKSDHWTMLALPPTGGAVSAPAPAVEAPRPSAASPCAELIARGVDAAGRGDKTGALEVFTAAASVCPSDPAPLREAAGVYALDGKWPESGRLARAAVARDPADADAWRILATSAYVTGDPAAALAAWNAAGEPVIDLVSVQGLSRTRHAVATRLIGLEAETVLTTGRLAAAGKRLGDLPAADLARVSYRPLPGGRASVEGVAVERERFPTSRATLAVAAVRLAIDRELVLSAASLIGAGELATVSWRWWNNRPRIAAAYAIPSSLGIWRAELFGEEQTYGRPEEAVVEQRRGGSVALSQWTSTLTRWQLGAGFDRWAGIGRTGTVSALVDQRLFDDRLSVHARGSFVAGAFRTWTAASGLDFRSSVRHSGAVLIGAAGVEAAGAESPRALWSGAGTGHGRGPLLRAHPLLDDGRIDGDVFGRRLFSASGEGRHWLKPVMGVIRIAPAVFVDAAGARHRLRPGRAWHVDAGAGLRVALPGAGVLRLDLAKGLRDGATALSIAWLNRF